MASGIPPTTGEIKIIIVLLKGCDVNALGIIYFHLSIAFAGSHHLQEEKEDYFEEPVDEAARLTIAWLDNSWRKTNNWR